MTGGVVVVIKWLVCDWWSGEGSGCEEPAVVSV